jgi:raffinose/stachyose/melibiose transport system substrate-binding protein
MMFRYKNSKSVLGGIALVSAGALLLAACSGTADDSTDASTASSGSETVELNFATWLPTQDQWPEIVAAFEEENPGITINFNRDEDYAAFIGNLDNEILAGTTPDLFGVQVGASLDDYADFALDTSEYATDWLDMLNAAAVEQTTTSDGKAAAVPILMGGMEYFAYNKTLMEELDLSLPTDYESLVEVSQAARDAGYSPFAMGAADTWHDADFFVWLSNQFGEGGDIYKAAAGDIDWDSESLVAAAQRWQDLFTDGVFEDAATTVTTYPAARDDYFFARKAPFFPTGSWHVGAAFSTSPEIPGSAVEGDEIGFALMPTMGDTDAGVTSGVDFALAISADSSAEKQAAAAKFVKFMAVGTGQELWTATLQGFPVSEDVTVELGDDESELAHTSLALTVESLQDSQYARKLVSPGNDALENDLGIILQKIADGADPASELATLNN